MRKILKFFLILYILSLVLHASVASASWDVYAVSAGVKYRPWDTPPANSSLTINAARGQWAAFQIACRVFNEDVNGVDVSITTPTMGSNKLNTPIIYKEVTYNVIIKSRDDGATGEWPDPLVPKVDQFYSEKRNAFPFNVKRVSPTYNVFDFNIGLTNPVTRNNGARLTPIIGGVYSGASPLNYHIKIDSGGTPGVATFKWSDTGGVSWKQTGVKTGNNVPLNNGLTITFPNQTYVLNDEWEFFANTFRNEMVWVDCYVPTDAVVGSYVSTIIVSANGKTNQTLNLIIKVYDVTIPKTSSIPTYFNSLYDEIAMGHFGTWAYQNPTATDTLGKRYTEAGLYHRIAIHGNQRWLTWDGKNIGNWSNAEGSGWKDQIAPYANGTWSWGAKLSAIKAPTTGMNFNFAPIAFTSRVEENDLTQSERDFLTKLAPLLNAAGWLSRSYIVFAEEPEPITNEMTNAIKSGGTTIHNINSNYKLIATKRLVSDWVPHIDVWNANNNTFGSYPRSAYDSEINAGRQLWSHLGCDSHGCNITGGSALNNRPSHAVDATLPNLRGYYWLMFDNDVRGDLYWHVINGNRYYIQTYNYPSPHDPWDSHYDFGADGDGTLFYPGRPDKIGGTNHIPIETIRLKALRMGLEDYEIFKYASDQCYSSYVKTQIESAVGNGKYYYTSTQPSNAAMETAKNNILNLFGPSIPLGATKDGSCSGGATLISPTPTITPSPIPEPTTTPTPSPTPTPLPSPTPTPPSDATCKMYLAVSQINTSGSPIGNIKSYEVSTTNASNTSNTSNIPISNSTNISAANTTNVSTGVQVVDSTKSPALDSNNLLKDSSKSSWSSGADGNKVDKGGVGEVLLKRDKARNIFTNLGDPNLMAESNEFATSNEKITPELLGLAPKDMTGREKLIQYIQGYDSYTKNKGNNTTKKREWLLGAILHSRPLVIPYKNSRSVIFVGANDGMFHAFDNATGEELWGFIPDELLSSLKNLTQGNDLKYYVDGSPKAYITSSQKIIVFGLRRGGSYYYALDVTDSDNPRFLWEIGPETTGFSELGQTWSTPQIGKIKYGSGEKVVCFIGGGYDESQDKKTITSNDKKGRALYVVDMMTGAQVWRWDYGKDPNMKYSIPSDISCVDTNGDGYIDRLYVGDMGGRLWRFDIRNSDPNAWSGRIVFNANTGFAGSSRKIFYPPDVTLEKGYEMVFFGTGDREHSDETKVTNQIFAIKDKGLNSTLSERDLENVTDGINNLKSIEGKEGWFISLENKGEKILAPPVVMFGVTYFTSFTPSKEDSNGGIARIYALNYKNGGPILDLNPENNTEGIKIDLSDRSKVIGTGIPSNTVISALAGKPIAFTGFSGGVYNTPLRGDSMIIPIWWREVSKK